MLNTSYFNWDKDSQTFTTEISDLPAFDFANVIKVKSHWTGNVMEFYFTHSDTDGEDIYGWWFKSKNGIKLLIIND